MSAWVLIFTLGLLATESVHIIHNVTRFTEEIFAFLIACVFLTDAIKKIIYVYKSHLNIIIDILVVILIILLLFLLLLSISNMIPSIMWSSTATWEKTTWHRRNPTIILRTRRVILKTTWPHRISFRYVVPVLARAFISQIILPSRISLLYLFYSSSERAFWRWVSRSCVEATFSEAMYEYEWKY